MTFADDYMLPIWYWASKLTLFPHRLPQLNIKAPVRTEQPNMLPPKAGFLGLGLEVCEFLDSWLLGES